MKIKVITLLFAFILGTQGECLPKHRFLFEFPKSAGSIRKMQIDLNQASGRWTVDIRSLRDEGKVFVGRLDCSEISENEYRCRRFDNGGGFELATQPAPKLTVKFFTADREGDEILTFLTGPDSNSATFTGKKAVLSAKDLF